MVVNPGKIAGAAKLNGFTPEYTQTSTWTERFAF
jgi:hypothetical protein